MRGGVVGSVFENDGSDGEVPAVGKAQMHVADAHGEGTLRCASCEMQGWPLAGLATDRDLCPGNAASNPRAESLGRGFLGAESGGKAFIRIAQLTATVGDLICGKDTVRKTVSIALNRLPDARDLHQVSAGAKDHGRVLSERMMMFFTVAPWDDCKPNEGAGYADRVYVSNYGLERNDTLADEFLEPLELRLQCLTYDDRAQVLPEMTDAIDRAGGRILDRRTVAAHALELKIELQVRALVDMYAALVGSGVDLTREAHLLLTERCMCRQHQQTRESMASILCIRLEVAFLADVVAENEWMQWVSRSAATA